jgi:Cupredoxin-like domain
MKKYLLPLAFVGVLCAAGTAFAAGVPSFVLTLKNHAFSPRTLSVPANQRVKLVVKNEDATPAEFESHDFPVEQVVSGHGQITVYVGPLTPGTYGFYDDFHEDTTRGKLVVK